MTRGYREKVTVDRAPAEGAAEGGVTDPHAPLFSLPLDDGAGALLGAAAGDVGGHAAPDGYSAITQASTVIAYHLLQVDGVDRPRLEHELRVLDGAEGGIPTYRGESPAFRRWLDSALIGEAGVSSEPSSEPAARMGPVGLWYRRRPDELVGSAISLARVTHLDGPTVVAAVAAAGAVAGSSFAQAGLDLVYGAAETAERALALLTSERYRFGAVDEAAEVVARLRRLAPAVVATPKEIVGAISGENGPVGVDGALLGILLGAAHFHDPVRLIEAAAMSGGSETGAVTGAIVGARSGLRLWPWRVANETWFAEIGRRLVTGYREVRDLPIPYAVEERTKLSPRRVPTADG